MDAQWREGSRCGDWDYQVCCRITVERQIKLWGVLKGSVETHDGMPMNSDSFICDLVLAKQFRRTRIMMTAILLTRPVDLTYRDLPIQGRN